MSATLTALNPAAGNGSTAAPVAPAIPFDARFATTADAMKAMLAATEADIAALYKQRERLTQQLDHLDDRINRQREIAMHLHPLVKVLCPDADPDDPEAA